MKLRLGVDGYAFATIDPVPQANAETKEISLTFVVDPKNRVYVRRVNFNGTSGVNDEVFRREMRQLEGAYLSNTAVERSKQRIQRLPFIEKVEVETNPVPGAADLVDVDFEIEEGLPGQFGGGVGYSESQSVILNGNFVHSNFMGTGNRIAAEINSGRYAKAFSFSHTDPLHDDRRSAALDLARLSRRHAVHLGDLGLRHRDDQRSASTTTSRSPSTSTSASASPRSAPSSSPPRAAAPTRRSTGCATTATRAITCRPIRCSTSDCDDAFEFEIVSSKFDTYELNVGWRYDSRNRAIFADRGMRHRFNVGYTLPGSDVEYWTRLVRLPAVHPDLAPASR